MENILTCPVCASADIAVIAESAWMINTGEFYCHFTKIQDFDAKATCLACRQWNGQLGNLLNQGKVT